MIRRVALLLALALGGAAAAWRWWSAPPGGSERELLAIPASVPADAEGAALVAEPARAARWLAGRPQAAALLALAAPGAGTASPELRSLLLAAVRKAPDVLVVWWRGSEVALATRLGGDDAAALARAAALTGTPCRTRAVGPGDVVIELASSPALLAPHEAAARPEAQPGRRSALCLTGGRWWRVAVGRSRLDAWSGAPPALPAPAGPSVVATADLAAFGRAFGAAAGLPSTPARLAFDAAGWAVALPSPGTVPDVRRLLTLGGDAPADSPPGARRWRGVLGDVWALPGPGLTVASSPALLGAVSLAAPAAEAGSVRGPQLADAVTRLAGGLDALPLFAARADALRRAAASARALRLARWSITPAGGRIALEW